MLVLKCGLHLSRNALARQINLQRALPASALIRSYCDFAHRWMPGPYPVTKEERDAAAKKYNMIPEDYIPCPPDSGLGDYPLLFRISHMEEARPYWMDYDEPINRRNFGETIAHDFHGQFEPPLNEMGKYEAWCYFWFVVIVAFLLWGMHGPEYMICKTKPKQYPHQYFAGMKPKKHYEFEMVD